MSYLYTMLENQDEISEELAEAIEKTDDFADVDTGETIALEATLEELDVAINVTSDQIAEGEKVEQEIAAPAEAVAESGEPMPMDEAPSAEGPDGTTQETRVLTHREAVLIGKRMKAIAAMSREQHLPSITQLSNETSGKFGYTMQALEGVRATLKRWWEKFKAFVMKYVDKITELFEKYVGEVARLARAAKKLNNKASDATGSKGDNFKISTSQYLNMCLTAKSDVDKIDENLKAAVRQLKGSSLSVKDQIKKVKDAGSTTRSAIGDYQPGHSGLTALVKSLYGTIDDVAAKGVISGGIATKTIDVSPTISDSWFGGGHYVVAIEGFDVKDVGVRKNVSFAGTAQYKFNNKDIKIKEDDEVKALDKSGITSLTNTIITVCDALLEAYKGARQLAAITKEEIKQYDTTIKKLENKNIADADDSVTNILTIARNGIKVQMDVARARVKGTKDSNQALLAAAKAAYNYANRSFSGLQKD